MPPDALDAFPFQKPLRFSAKTDRGRASLDEALADAVTWLRRNQGVDKIGKGRAEVKARLEAMRDEDAGRPPAERRHRLMTQAEFVGLCDKAGNISSPGALLDYLHNCGTVFYRQGLFGDRIILDQAWALDAVYAVFDRDRRATAICSATAAGSRRSELRTMDLGRRGIRGRGAGAVSQPDAAMRHLLPAKRGDHGGSRAGIHRARSAPGSRGPRDRLRAAAEMGRAAAMPTPRSPTSCCRPASCARSSRGSAARPDLPQISILGSSVAGRHF